MKIYALNASPRKNWNSNEMLDAFIKGVSETNPDIEVEKVNLDDIAFFFRNQFRTEPEELYVCNTLHWKNPEKYKFPMDWYIDKSAYHDERFSSDLQSCYDAGVRLANKICHLQEKKEES